METIRLIESVIVRIIGLLSWLFRPPARYFLIAIAALYILNKIYWAIRAIMLKKLVYTRSFSDDGVFAGEWVEMTETIRNEGWFPMLWIDVEAYLFGPLKLAGHEQSQSTDMQHFISRFHLMPYTQIRRRHSIHCTQRGFYQLTTASVLGKYVSFYFHSPAELYVYPKPWPPPVPEMPTQWIQGEYLSRLKIFTEPFSFAGIRDYRFGDPMSWINFKASARIPFGAAGAGTSALKVNERDFCSTRRVMILFNVHPPAEAALSDQEYCRLVEQGLSYVSDIISRGIFSGFAVGFAANSRGVDGAYSMRIACEGGEHHLVEILKVMALIRPRGGTSFTTLIEKEITQGLSDVEYLVFGLEFEKKSLSMLEMLKTSRNSIAVVRLWEEELPHARKVD